MFSTQEKINNSRVSIYLCKQNQRTLEVARKGIKQRIMSKVRFSSVIDALTDRLQRFGVTQDENYLDIELDYIVNKMTCVKVEVDDKWDILQENYSKLKYLYELVNFYNMPTEGKFIKSLEKFMEKIDKQNQFYLREIDWDCDYIDFKIECSIIKKSIEKSLQRNNVFKKLADVLKAYEILVCVVEDIRGEQCEVFVEPEWLEHFERPLKRSKH